MSTSGGSDLFSVKSVGFSWRMVTLRNCYHFLKLRRTTIPGKSFELCALQKSLSSKVVSSAREALCLWDLIIQSRLAFLQASETLFQSRSKEFLCPSFFLTVSASKHLSFFLADSSLWRIGGSIDGVRIKYLTTEYGRFPSTSRI